MTAIRLVATVVATLICASPAFSQAGNKPSNWQRIEADNGAVYQIDLNSISHNSNGTADVVVYAVEGPSYNPENMRRLWFDCQGRYRDQTGPGIGPIQYAPPRSIAGRLSEIACRGAKDKRLQETTRLQPKDTPDQYCAGFSREACARIAAAVEAKTKPSFCRPGFGLVGSGLSSEQLRICYVITSEQARLENIAKSQTAGKSSQARTYDLDISATRGGFPSIVGSTNLPDGTKLLVSIKKRRLPNANERLATGLAMCEDDCLPASGPKGERLGVATTVLSGAFSAGPFSWGEKPFRQGNFEVEVYLVSLPDEDASGRNINQLVDRMKKPILTASVVVNP